MVKGVAAIAALFLSAPGGAQVMFDWQHADVTVSGTAGGTAFDRFVDGGATAEGADGRAIADGLGNGVTVAGSSRIAADLRAPGAGSVRFTQSATVAQTLNTSTDADLGGSVAVSGTYIYGFTITSAMRFALSWDVTSDGMVAGGPGPSMVVWLKDDQAANFAFYSDPLDQGTGRLSAIIGPSHYAFNVQNFSLTTASDMGPAASSLAGRVDFALSAVPEPAGWATMILGMGMAGAAVRRRRVPVAA